LETDVALYRAAHVFGATNRYGTIFLADAVFEARLCFEGQAHSALGDVLTTLAVRNLSHELQQITDSGTMRRQ